VAGLGDLPHRHVQRVVLGRVVGPPAELRGQGQRHVPGQPGALGHARAAEVDTAAALVGGTGLEQPRGQPDHVRHVPVRARLVFRRADPDRGHVTVEAELLDRGELVVGRARPARRYVEHVVHVGDVAAHLRLDAEQAQHPAERVDPHERGRMPEMGHVIGGDAAGIDAGPVQQFHPLSRDHRPGRAAGCVGCHEPSLDQRARAPSPGNPKSSGAP
jgi:hypothetical protein